MNTNMPRVVRKNIRSKVGRRVRILRLSRGWSQETLAEKTGLHPTYVGGIERGERNVGLINLNRIARAFSLSLSKFFQFCDGKGHACVGHAHGHEDRILRARPGPSEPRQA